MALLIIWAWIVIENSMILPNYGSIVNETSPEANWNGQTDRQTDGRTEKPRIESG